MAGTDETMGEAQAVTARPRGLDAFQRRHRVIGFPIAVAYKYFDDTGAYLAALLTYYGFLSLFPLLLLLSTALGIVLDNNDELRERILDTALTQFPIVGDQLGDPQQLSGGTFGIVVGVLGTLYGGIGVAQALQHSMNTAWNIPRNSRPNPFLARGRSLLLLAVGGVGVLAMSAVSVVAGTGVVSGPLARILVGLGATLVGIVVLVVVFRMSTARPVTVRQVLPGAIFAALGWQALQHFGIAYVDHVVRNASTSNGVFALVLGLVAFLYVSSIVLLLGVELNVVRVERMYPRALLTPFTDNVILTDGDRRSYVGIARSQRHKGFQRIDVEFAPSPPERRAQATEGDREGGHRDDG